MTLKKAGGIPFYIKDDKLFVCLFVSNDGTYGGTAPQIAKGHVDEYETQRDAAVREVFEETGVDVGGAPRRTVFSGPFAGQVEDYYLSVYLYKLDDRVEPAVGDEGEGVWYPIEDALCFIRLDQQAILEQAKWQAMLDDGWRSTKDLALYTSGCRTITTAICRSLFVEAIRIIEPPRIAFRI